ncbi:hypothetical protein [Gluconobacter oxydans]|uniref:hypothetical protein n=1 Tax=Gluconobacter oxydans TaxID=442 RepID=UPI0039E7D2FB
MGNHDSFEELPLLSDPVGRGRQSLHGPKPSPRPKAQRKRGLTIQEIADRDDLWGEGPSPNPRAIARPDKETLYRLLQENCWLERAPFGREQSRWFVTDKAVECGYGQTVDPSNTHSFVLSGPKKSFPFPVFYEDKVRDVVWTLGWDVILDQLNTIATKKERLAWLMAHHSYLPAKAISQLSGVGIATAKRHKAQNDTQ